MPGIVALLRNWLRFRKVGIVLVGHGLTINGSNTSTAPYHDDFNEFARAIRMYEDRGFEFITMEELIEVARAGFRVDKNWVHLTFDDGYESISKLAYPYLSQKQIPFSLYISTNHIEHAKRFYTYRIRCSVLNTKEGVRIPSSNLALTADATTKEKVEFAERVVEQFKKMNKGLAIELMAYLDSLLSAKEWAQMDAQHREDNILTINQVRELANDKLVHIGSHNHNHLILNQNVSEKDILFEMRESREWLRRNLGDTVITYSYPNGTKDDFTASSIRICKGLGYELAFTSIDGFVSPATDRYQIPRMWLATSSDNFSRRLLKFLLPDRVVGVVYILRSVLRSDFPWKGPIKQVKPSESPGTPAAESVDI